MDEINKAEEKLAELVKEQEELFESLATYKHMIDMALLSEAEQLSFDFGDK